ncbi:MAG: response regulator [Lewinellaceae bacterium]|nr:response regulator [Lewinellaceae bacterium]
MKSTLFACCLLLLPLLLYGQSGDPKLDSLARPLPSGASARKQFERLEKIVLYICMDGNLSYGDYVKQLDSLYRCCLAGKTGDMRYEGLLAAKIVFFQGCVLINDEPKKAQPLLLSAIEQFKVLGDSFGIALGYTELAANSSSLGDSLAFASYHNHAVAFAPHIHDSYYEALIHNNIGIGCYDFGRFAEAANHYFRSLELIERYKTPALLDLQRDVYHNLCGVYSRLEDWNNALIYVQKAIESAEARGQNAAVHYPILARCYLGKKEYAQALDAYQKAEKYFPTESNEIARGNIKYGLATCYRMLGNVSTALTYARQAVGTLPVSVNAPFGAVALEVLAACEFDAGLVDSALHHALIAYQTFREARQNGGLVRIAELLTNIYKSKGAYRKALEYSELRYQYQSQVERQQSTRQLAFGEFTRTAEVEKARREAEVQAQLDRQRNIRYALFAGLAVLALLAFLLYHRYRFKQRTATQLEAKNCEVEAARLHAEQERLRAEKSEAFKSRFLANMSHEIRTPLHGISGYTDLLLETSLAEKQRRYLTAIRHSNERLTEVVNDILDLSKLEAGEVKLREVPFSPAQIARDVQDALAPRAETKGIELSVEIGENVPEALLGDPTRLYQILMNLAGNAVKFTETGRVTLAIEGVTTVIEGVTRSHPLNMRFTVTDTGIGIPPEKLTGIFESFRQADDDTTARFGGTGLGLTIARELVQLHGSDIRVESEVGKGSVFSFGLALPLADAAGLEKTAGATDDLFFSKKLRVLLADDNDYNREIAVEALLRHFEQVEIVEAANGREVLGLLEHSGGDLKSPPEYQPFDLILMDMQMPEMSGTEATRYIRQQLRSDIPIIALTASATPEEIENALASGMNRHLGKPFKPRELARVIAQTLGLNSETRPAGFKTTPAGFGTTSAGFGTTSAGFETLPTLRYDLRFLRDFCNGDEAQVRHFIEKFEAQWPLELEKLETAFSQNDREAIYRAAHGFKPQLEFVGLSEATHLAAALEQGAQNGQPVAALRQVFAQLTTLME